MNTLKELIEAYGEAVVTRWALKEWRQWSRREAKEKIPKSPSIKSLNKWLKEATPEEIEALKKRAILLR